MKQRKLVEGPGLRPGIPMPEFSNAPKHSQASDQEVQSDQDSQDAPASGLALIDINLLDDSESQYRLVYPKDEIEELAMLLKAGQTTPIRVRKKANGRYEIIAGHRRKRAAPIAGMTHLLAVVAEVDDIRAAIEVMVDNDSAESTGDFERAMGYKALMAKGLKQSDIAEALRISKSLVSMRLDFLKLPPPVIQVLMEYPRAYSYTTVPKLLKLLKDTPKLLDEVADGTRKVGLGEWTAQGFLTQMIRQQNMLKTGMIDPAGTEDFAILDKESRPVLTLKSKPNGRVEIQLAKGVDQAKFMTSLNSLLRDEAAKQDTGLAINAN